MPQKRRSGGRRSEPKLFRCTGYGDCNMVFTRSEHLARHARKHTGEKPFKCVVPGCDRMFSRFDNMMQHTQTHNRHKKKGSTPSRKSSNAGSERRHSMSSLSKTTQDVGSSPSPSSSSSSSSYYPPPPSMIQSRTLPLPSRRASYSGGAQPGPYYQHPPPSLPITPLSEENDVYPFHQGIPSYHPLAPHPTAGHRVRSSWPPAYYSPVSPPPAPHPTAAAARLHLPPGATADHPLDVVAPHHHHRWPFPDVFGGHPVPPWRVSTSSSSSYADHRRSSVSTIDSGASLSSTSSSSRGDAARAEGNFRRRLSAADLQVPIEHLQAITLGDQCLHPQDKTMKKETDFGYEESKPTHPLSKWSPEDVPIKQEEEEEEEETAKNEQPGQPAEDRSDRTVDITSDEYEALQGFGKFRAQSIVNSESRDPLVGSPNIASQVYAFRQRLMPVQESFQRPMRHDAV